MTIGCLASLIWRSTIYSCKRTLDFVAAALALLAAMPLIVLLSVLVFLFLGTPVFFRQKRIGLKDEPFEIVKFRTMLDATDQAGNLLSDEERLTSLGRFLRSTSLDELPELWNVLRGEMSLVGPRPLLPEYLPYYSAEEKRRHEVRPGLTGLAQINGRNATTWERRLELDVSYVENLSFFGDVKILFLTVWRVVARDGISAAGHATMPRFDDYVRSGRKKDETHE